MMMATKGQNRARLRARGWGGVGLVGLIALTALAARPARASAQDWWFGFTYGAGVPTGDTKEFTGDTPSWRNFGVEGRKHVAGPFTLGFSLGWNVFTEKTTETASFEGTDISGTQFRYLNSFPILLTGHAYLGGRSRPYQSGLRAFVGAGVGAYVIENRVDIGLLNLTDTNWHFGVAPEAGVAWKASGPWALMASARWNYAAKSNDITHSYFSFNAGIVWSN